MFVLKSGKGDISSPNLYKVDNVSLSSALLAHPDSITDTPSHPDSVTDTPSQSQSATDTSHSVTDTPSQSHSVTDTP